MADKWEKCSAETRRCYQIVHEPATGRELFIQFMPCGVVSQHPKDIEHKYCAFCDRHTAIGDRVMAGERGERKMLRDHIIVCVAAVLGLVSLLYLDHHFSCRSAGLDPIIGSCPAGEVRP